MAMAAGGNVGLSNEINVTPMIDVLLAWVSAVVPGVTGPAAEGNGVPYRVIC